MKRISFSFLYPLIALVMLIYVLNRNVFMVPALGTSLNPFLGVVQNEKDTIVDQEMTFGLESEVSIIFDERAVPHIFSNHQNDMYFAQGYVCAADRLWQMDFLSYNSAGRMSEIFGPDFLDYDRTQRRNGMLRAAQTSLKFIEKDAQTKAVMDQYTAGVNTYINGLNYEDLPLEYKMLGYSPEPWTNLKSVLIMKYLSATLSGYDQDISASYMRLALGKTEYERLFSSYSIQTDSGRFGLNYFSDTLPDKDYIDFPLLDSPASIAANQFNPRLGSNSWVVSPEKSASGQAILCSDPHLNLSLPAIWYELQLSSEEQNTYGYSIPGVPGIIIGFNEEISWGLTNGATDVKDYYKLELTPDYGLYRFDDKWVNTEMVIEEIKIMGEDSFFDTVYYSMHGPISSDYRFGSVESEGYAVDWTLHEPSNEFLTFVKLNKAEGYEDFKEAIQHYNCPVQNFSYADVEGNIALHHQGKIYKDSWKNQGAFLLDGTQSDHLFSDGVEEDLPHAFNPDQGFVFSANNNPLNPEDSAIIQGHYTELRANKLLTVLSAKQKFSVEDMKALQLDNTNRLAELAMPVLLDLMSESENKYIKQFRSWNAKYEADSKLALVFESWWTHIKINTWDELAKLNIGVMLPDDLVLLDLISNDPNNPYFDLIATEEVESAKDIVEYAFNAIWQNVGIYQNWGAINTVNISHLSNVPDFSRLGIVQGGHPDALNAMAKNWGPSLRMIVEMGDRPKGYGIYAGGQSGNPASNQYDRFIDDWAAGVYYDLHFFKDQEQAKNQQKGCWTIK